MAWKRSRSKRGRSWRVESLSVASLAASHWSSTSNTVRWSRPLRPDADFGLASALARCDVDRADPERLADPEPAQQQQCHEGPVAWLGPRLGDAQERVGLVAVEAEVRVLVLDGRATDAAHWDARYEFVLVGELVERGDDREPTRAGRRRERPLGARQPRRVLLDVGS